MPGTKWALNEQQVPAGGAVCYQVLVLHKCWSQVCHVTLGVRWFFVVEGCPVRCKMVRSILGLHALNGTSTPPPPVVTVTNVPKCCQTYPWEQNCPDWKLLIYTISFIPNKNPGKWVTRPFYKEATLPVRDPGSTKGAIQESEPRAWTPPMSSTSIKWVFLKKKNRSATDVYSALQVQLLAAQSQNVYMIAYFTSPPFLLTFNKQIFRATLPIYFSATLLRSTLPSSSSALENNPDLGIKQTGSELQLLHFLAMWLRAGNLISPLYPT